LHSKYFFVHISAKLRIVLRDHRGAITLAELLASMVVSAITMAAIYHITLMQDGVYQVQNQVAEMQQTAGVAKTMMVRELEMAGYNPTGAAFCGVGQPPAQATCTTAPDTTQLRLRTDSNGNGTTTDAREDITYRYDAANRRITRLTDGVMTIIPNVEAFTFTYIRADGAAATTSVEIRQVNVSLRVRTARTDREWNLNGGFRTYTLDFSVTPKNLGL
jgi:type IV pilus assembly protein PilW